MTDIPQAPSWLKMPDQLSMTDDEWSALSRAYQSTTMSDLMNNLASINSQLEAQARSAITVTLQQDLDRADHPAVRSPMTVDPSPMQDRSPQPSLTQQPGAFDLYMRSNRVGPRVAARIVKAQARAHARRKAMGRE